MLSVTDNLWVHNAINARLAAERGAGTRGGAIGGSDFMSIASSPDYQ
jgi:hypothetical protein